MKAIIYEKYGGPEVLKLVELPTPEPSQNEIQIKVFASSATTGDWRVRSMSLPKGFHLLGRLFLGVSGPRQKILGSELSGTVVQLGKNVTKFKLGDEVIAQCGTRMGCYVEYKILHEDDVIVRKPHFLSFEEAAVISFGASTAWSFLVEQSKTEPGMSILVNGASGSVGTAAIQIAKAFGAQVTAVCSAPNFELAKSLGADIVIDYNQADFTQNGKHYDKIMDCVGNLFFSGVEGSLTDRGELLLVSAGLPQLLHSLWVNWTKHRKVISGPVAANLRTLSAVMKLIEQRNFVPVLDQVFSMSQISQAHAYVEKRHRKGNVAITIQESALLAADKKQESNLTDPRKLLAVRANEIPPRTKPSNYPEPFFSRMVGREKRQLGDFFGLKNFGVNLTRLEPNSQSSLFHRHSKQDEFIFILEGTATLITDDGEFLLQPGMCAGFPANAGGISLAHQLLNRSQSVVVYIEVGDRTPGDDVDYPRDDLKALIGNDGKWRFTHKNGDPY